MRLILSTLPLLLAANMCGQPAEAPKDEPAPETQAAPPAELNPIKQIPKEYDEAIKTGAENRERALEGAGVAP